MSLRRGGVSPSSQEKTPGGENVGGFRAEAPTIETTTKKQAKS